MLHGRKALVLALTLLLAAVGAWACGAGGDSTSTATIAVAVTSTAVPCTDENAIGIVRRSVVRISTDDAVGTGIVVGDNEILTNAHVVEDYEKVRVESQDDAGEGTVVGTDNVIDLALIQAATHALPAVKFADPSSLRPGQRLLAIGYALDLPGEPSTTGGIFSALRELDGVHYVQTDAPINPGNSGGPLFTQCGEVVGLNTSGNRAGIGFAIDSSALRTANHDLAAQPPKAKPTSDPSSLQPFGIGDQVVVTGIGEPDCLRVREQPTARGQQLACEYDGTKAIVQQGPVDAETFTWWRIAGDGFNGWVVAQYLERQ